MKRFGLILYTLLMVITVQAQTTIRGIILDEKGEALTGANIYIENIYDGTSSDLEGKFEFKTSEQGTRSLRVEFVGFEPIIEPPADFAIQCNLVRTFDSRFKEYP